MNFAQYASKVTMLVRGESLKNTLSNYLLERIAETSNMQVRTRCEIVGIDGADKLSEVSYRCADGQVETVAATAVFLCIGGAPRTDWVPLGMLALDSAGYILTGTDIFKLKLGRPWKLDRAPLFMETNLSGLFAAGDVRHNSIKRCATAVGEGATAVSMVHQYLATRHMN